MTTLFFASLSKEDAEEVVSWIPRLRVGLRLFAKCDSKFSNRPKNLPIALQCVRLPEPKGGPRIEICFDSIRAANCVGEKRNGLEQTFVGFGTTES